MAVPGHPLIPNDTQNTGRWSVIHVSCMFALDVRVWLIVDEPTDISKVPRLPRAESGTVSDVRLVRP